MDGEAVLEESDMLEHSIPVAGLQPGEHTVSVKANGVGTRYPLSLTRLDAPTKDLMPVMVEKSFHVK
jgi:hypothetical protein